MIDFSQLNKKLIILNSFTGQAKGVENEFRLIANLSDFQRELMAKSRTQRLVFSEKLADLRDEEWAHFLDLFASYVYGKPGSNHGELNEDWCEEFALADLVSPQAVVTSRSKVENSTPEFSIIIPFRNREESLRPMLLQMAKLEDIGCAEVILVDDASKIPLEKSFADLLSGLPFDWKILRLSPSQIFRAGIARNAGSLAAKSENLLFVDSDFILPTDYLVKNRLGFTEAELLQAKRWQIWRDEWNGHSAPLPIGRREPNRFWNEFQTSDYDWNSIPQGWKYVSSFCLSVKRSRFLQLGGFRSWYSNYGSEDTDFGLRCFRAGMKFKKLDADVHHLSTQTLEEWYATRPQTRLRLKRSARKFLMINQTLESLDWLTYMMLD